MGEVDDCIQPDTKKHAVYTFFACRVEMNGWIMRITLHFHQPIIKSDMLYSHPDYSAFGRHPDSNGFL